METNNYNKREDKPTPNNPEEVNSPPSAEKLHAQRKIDIKESELGREQGQTPAEEHIEDRISQIDEGTKSLHRDNRNTTTVTSESEPSENHDVSGFMNDANSNTDRDTGSSTNGGWDAETSKTSRHK